MAPAGRYGQSTGMQFQIASPNSEVGTKVAQDFFRHLEDSILKSESYRGKILSLEQSRHSYTGQSNGITVHKLRRVERDQVILPKPTIALLERNVIQFVKQREKLSRFRQATKKGLLFYGPPGTGKTHTIHYLARALEGHTTLLISAEQVGLLSEYMTLARLLQPSIVVIEDVDLIARDRSQMNSPCEEVLLNKLLNEMDGLKEEADILFILTTNRPEALEAALAARPGRIDQAIEFPLPDEEGRPSGSFWARVSSKRNQTEKGKTTIGQNRKACHAHFLNSIRLVDCLSAPAIGGSYGFAWSMLRPLAYANADRHRASTNEVPKISKARPSASVHGFVRHSESKRGLHHGLIRPGSEYRTIHATNSSSAKRA